MAWSEVWDWLGDKPLTVIVYLLIVYGSIIFSIKVFIARSKKSRKTMIKHTFQILYADSVVTKLAGVDQADP